MPPEFHNLVLSTGTVPLEILEQQVNAWIETVAAVAALPQRLAPVASAAANAPEVRPSSSLALNDYQLKLVDWQE